MSVRRVLLFILGTLVAGALLMFLLPLAGIPASHFLPPNRVYLTAKGETRGSVVGKYYDETGNPFHVGDHQYFVNYKFRAHAPPPRGSTVPGPGQDYGGTTRVDKGTYDEFPIREADKNTVFAAKQEIALAPYPVKIKFETSYPEISGI